MPACAESGEEGRVRHPLLNGAHRAHAVGMTDAHALAASTRGLKVAAVLGACSGLGFGIPCAFGLRHFARTGEVWTFMRFPTYGKGPFEKAGLQTSVPLLGAFLVVCSAEVATAWLLWKRPRTGTAISHVLLPAELLFWAGFALPFGPPLGVARTIAIIAAHRNHS